MSTTSTKPQIFINNVDQTISEETISKACEEICSNKPTSITLRPSHDKKNNLCVITLSNQAEAEALLKAGSITTNSITLKVEEYQAQFPNLFLKNEGNLISEQELQEGLRALIKGNFHVYYGSDCVSFFIQDEAELAKLVNETVEIKGKPCTFQKYVANSAKKEKTHLFLRFAAANKAEISSKLLEQLTQKFGPIVQFTAKEPKNDTFTISIIFKESKDAEQLFQHIEDEKHILFGQTVNVSWKKQEEVESEDKFIFVKWLAQEATEQELKKAFSKYGEVLSIELQTIVTAAFTKKFAILQMNSADACTEAMANACTNNDIKKLFFNQRVQVSPYFSKSEQDALSKASQDPKAKPYGIPQSQSAQPNLYQANYQLPQQQVPQTGQFQMMQMHPQMVNQMMPPQLDQQAYYQQMLQMQQAAFYANNGFNQRKQYNNNYYPNNQNSHYRQQKGEDNKNPSETGNNLRKNKYQNNNYNNRQQPQQQYQPSNPQQVGQGFNQRTQTQAPNQQVVYQKQPKHQTSQLAYQQMNLQQMQEQAKNPEKFKELVLPSLKDLVEKELKAKYPDQISQQDQVVQMLTDAEIFSTEEIVKLLYDQKEFKERIDEAITLILSPNEETN